MPHQHPSSSRGKAGTQTVSQVQGQYEVLRYDEDDIYHQLCSMGGRSPRLQRRVGSLTSEEVISSFNYTVSNFDNEESDNRAAWVRR